MSASGSEPGAERREALRVGRTPLEVKVLGTRTINGRVVDLSTGGLLIEVDQGLPRIGSEVQLKLRLPQEKTRLQPAATVVRHAGPRQFAVRFMRITNEELSALQRHVAREGALEAER